MPEVLEQIYNGFLNVDEKVLTTFSKMEPRLVVQMLGYGNFAHWDNLSQQTLDRIAEAFKSVDHEICENWTLRKNLHSEKFVEFFTKMSDEELSVLNVVDVFSRVDSNIMNIDSLQEQIGLIPSKLRTFIKDGNSTDLFWGGFIFEAESSQNKFKELENLSNEELKTLGGHIIVNYLNSCRFDTLNPQNISEWKKVPQEIRDYLKENGIDFVTSDKNVDINLINTRFEALKNIDVQKSLEPKNFMKIVKMSDEKFEFIKRIVSDEKYEKENANYLINALSDKNSDIIRLIEKVLKNKKFDINYLNSFIW